MGVIRYVQLTVRLKGALLPDSSAFSAMQTMGPRRSVRRTSAIFSTSPGVFSCTRVPSTTKASEPFIHLYVKEPLAEQVRTTELLNSTASGTFDEILTSVMGSGEKRRKPWIVSNQKHLCSCLDFPRE